MADINQLATMFGYGKYRVNKHTRFLLKIT